MCFQPRSHLGSEMELYGPLDLHKIKLQTFDFKNRFFESIKYGVGCARTKNRNYKFDNYKVNIKKDKYHF